MTDPKVSVLMSVYNGEQFLRESIESILYQIFSDFEFLIINDGSTDGSKEIILSYNDPRIRLIENEMNIGLTKSLNKVLRAAKGKYIARMDSDDICKPDRLESQVTFLDNNPDFKLVGSWCEIIDNDGKLIDVWKLDFSPDYINYILHFRNCLTHSTVMFDRALALELNGYNESIERAQDYEFWTRFNKKTRIMQLQEFLLQRRHIDTAISVKYKPQQNEYVGAIVANRMKCVTDERIPENYLALMGDNYAVLDKLSIREKREVIRYLKLIHNYFLIDYPQFIESSKLKDIFRKRCSYLSVIMFIHSLSPKLFQFLSKARSSINFYFYTRKFA